ncbi:MAG: diguanylate cyclase, partial [Gammaproteobacteria bacterium]|nr:diguanylate cyclase [Gammaproteobacteria bacterium]
IRQAVEQTEFCKQMKALQVTVSVGVVEFPASSELSLQRVFAHADTLLYQAKQQGRNQVQAAFL